MHQRSLRRPASQAATLLAVAGLAAFAPTDLRAQIVGGNPVAAGLGGNFLAAARGASAVEWNPANLGLADSPLFSLRVLTAGGISALDPVSWHDVASLGGQDVSRDVRQGWLDRVTAAGGESGEASGGMTLLAVGLGRFGVHVGASGYATARMSPDAAEALLFGNAGRTGQPRDLRLAGSAVRAGAFATTAVSYAQPLSAGPSGAFALGVTVKHVAGAGMVRAADAGSAVTASKVAVAFPIVHSSADGGTAGRGLGLDVGAAWTEGRLTLGAKVENAVSTFGWDASRLRYRAGTAAFDGTASASSFDEQPFAQAPQSLRAAVEAERFAPALAAGLAFRRTRSLLVTADARYGLGGAEALAIGPKSHAGVGVESRLLGWLPLRVGGAVVTGGWQASAGAGLRLGAYELSAAYLTRHGERGTAPGLTVSVVAVH